MTREDAACLREYKLWFYDTHGHVPTAYGIATFAALAGIVLDEPPALGGMVIEFPERDTEHFPPRHIGNAGESDDTGVGAEP
jgi:hypothetical protein